MDYTLSPDLLEFQKTVRAFIKTHMTPELRAEVGGGGMEAMPGPALAKFRQAMNETGFTTMAWPREYGGQGRGGLYSFILYEELGYNNIPFDSLSVNSVGATIMQFGREDQKRDWLPKVQTGEITFAIGYTEPDAGTDLASLQTRAVRDGDDFIINGQKIFTSSAHISSHIWFAARTDPTAPKHRGVSMFVFPLSTPGITVRPLWTMGEIRTNETFFEDVRIPASAMVGEQNRGWYIVQHALDLERVAIGTYRSFERLLDDVLAYLKASRPALLKDPYVRAALAEAKMDLEMQRALATTNATMVHNGLVPTMEGSMSKVWGTDATSKFTNAVIDILGRAGALDRRSGDDAPMGGAIQTRWRGTPVGRFGGGTNDIQRRIIACRGLGLPRG